MCEMRVGTFGVVEWKGRCEDTGRERQVRTLREVKTKTEFLVSVISQIYQISSSF